MRGWSTATLNATIRRGLAAALVALPAVGCTSPDTGGAALTEACAGHTDLLVAAVRSESSNGATGSLLLADPDLEVVGTVPTGPNVNAGDPSFSPDGTTIVFVRGAGPIEHEVSTLWTIRVDGSHLDQLTGTAEWDEGLDQDEAGSTASLDVQPDWSSTGTIAYVGWNTGTRSDRGIYLITPGGDRRALRDEDGAIIAGFRPRWAPDGKQLAFTVADGLLGEALWVADADGTRAREVVPRDPSGGHIDQVVWSTDGARLFFSVMPNSSTAWPPLGLRVVDLAGGAVTRIGSSVGPLTFTRDGHRLVAVTATAEGLPPDRLTIIDVSDTNLTNLVGAAESELGRAGTSLSLDSVRCPSS